MSPRYTIGREAQGKNQKIVDFVCFFLVRGWKPLREGVVLEVLEDGYGGFCGLWGIVGVRGGRVGRTNKFI